jgi:starch synthase
MAPPRLGRVKLAITTREWPPEVYGGAGVHVTELVKALRPHIEVDVFCMGAERDDAQAFPLVGAEAMNTALKVLSADVQMAAAVAATDADVVHSHTWYANMAGHLAGATKGIPHVISAHSLEPDRPWKLDQLGGGYRVSSWVEQEAYRAAATIIAVSHGMRTDVLRAYPFLDPAKVTVVHNGVDTAIWKPSPDEDALRRMGIDSSRPYVLFVGRITRQKGLVHLLAAAHHFPMGVQIVLAASSPDEAGIGEEVSAGIAALSVARPGDVVWLNTNVAKADVITLQTHATVFLCPSVYEPLGIVNLEAMACGTAVVASAVGGIPEVVVDGTTGLLVEWTPDDPVDFQRRFAAAVTQLIEDPERAKGMGALGRDRAVNDFGWDAIALRTIDVYRSVMN